MKSMVDQDLGPTPPETPELVGDGYRVFEKLREANARLTVLMQSISDVIYFNDMEGRFQLADRTVKSFMDVDHQDLND